MPKIKLTFKISVESREGLGRSCDISGATRFTGSSGANASSPLLSNLQPQRRLLSRSGGFYTKGLIYISFLRFELQLSLPLLFLHTPRQRSQDYATSTNFVKQNQRRNYRDGARCFSFRVLTSEENESRKRCLACLEEDRIPCQTYYAGAKLDGGHIGRVLPRPAEFTW